MVLGDELEIALEAVKKVEYVIKEGYEKLLNISIKEGKGVVTEIDQISEQKIVEFLQSKSKFPILAEENGLRGQNSGTYWVLDPLDGTTNFTRKIPFIGISLALIHNNKILVGVVSNPLQNECYYAQSGKGSFCNNKKIRVSDSELIKMPTVFINTGYGQDDIKRYSEAVRRLSLDFSVRKFGTTALELCYVAKGSAEAFMSSGDELWDYAAGLVIVEEAGGCVTDWHGNAWNNSSSYILATNNMIHNNLIKRISDLQT